MNGVSEKSKGSRQASDMTERREFPYHVQEWPWYSLLLPKQPLRTAGLRVKSQQRDHSFRDRADGEGICF